MISDEHMYMCLTTGIFVWILYMLMNRLIVIQTKHGINFLHKSYADVDNYVFVIFNEKDDRKRRDPVGI